MNKIETIPQLIKQARRESGLTQLSLADKIGAKKNYITRIERGAAISIEKASEILSAMGYNLNVEYRITKKEQ